MKGAGMGLLLALFFGQNTVAFALGGASLGLFSKYLRTRPKPIEDLWVEQEIPSWIEEPVSVVF